MDHKSANRIASKGNDAAFADRAKKAAARNADKDKNPPSQGDQSGQEPSKDDKK